MFSKFKKKDRKHLQSHVLFRHGNRTPLFFPPNCINELETYKEGVGNLTERGKQLSIELGKLFKERYIETQKLFKIKDIEEKLYVRSSDIQRTYETAYNVLKGFIESSKPIIEVEIAPSNFDEMLQPKIAYPFVHSEFLEKKINSKEWIEITEQNFTFFQELSKLCGTDISLSNVVCLKQFFDIQKENDRLNPSWVTEEILKKLDELCFHATKITYEIENNYYKILNAGVFLHKVITEFDRIINKVKNVKKLYLYSGQDININSVLGAMGFDVGAEINFHAAISFELIKFKGDHFVQVYLKNDESGFTNLKIKDHTNDCSFKDFKELYQQITTESLANLFDTKI